MSSWSELLDRAEPEEHVVQRYGSDDQLLTRNVSRYFAEGLARGDGLVMVATGSHADSILRQLQEEPAGAPQALRNGRLVVLDARTTLDGFMVDGQPEQHRFRDVVGSLLQRVRTKAPSGRDRAFGEMVGLLWADGRQSAAAALETFWNELLARSACSLFCAYPIDVLNGGSPAGGLDAILGAHTHAYAGPRTMRSGPRSSH